MLEDKKALIFDLDGMLVDTKEFNRLAIVEPIKDFDCHPDSELVERAMHLPWDGCVRMIFDGFPEEIIRQYKRAVVEYQLQRFHTVNFFPHTEWALERQYRLGRPMAIVSNRDEETIFPLIEQTGLSLYFPLDRVVHCDMVEKPKPDREPTLLGCQMVEEDPQNVIGAGDSPTDIISFLAAGVGTTVAFTEGYFKSNRAALEAVEPHYLVSSFRALDGIIFNHGNGNSSGFGRGME
jgi:phosphoglycolate phosphatase-like HAD superfamily hydrolase